MRTGFQHATSIAYGSLLSNTQSEMNRSPRLANALQFRLPHCQCQLSAQFTGKWAYMHEHMCHCTPTGYCLCFPRRDNYPARAYIVWLEQVSVSCPASLAEQEDLCSLKWPLGGGTRKELGNWNVPHRLASDDQWSTQCRWLKQRCPCWQTLVYLWQDTKSGVDCTCRSTGRHAEPNWALEKDTEERRVKHHCCAIINPRRTSRPLHSS